MDPTIPSLWWMDAAQAPVIAGLYWLLLGIKRDLDRRIEKGTSRHDDGLSRTRDELADQSLDELEGVPGLDAERAGKLIMAARAHWFENADQA